jgi:hypothetical protein
MKGRQTHITPAPPRKKRAAGERAAPAPIVVTDENVDELCERLRRLPKDSVEYDPGG